MKLRERKNFAKHQELTLILVATSTTRQNFSSLFFSLSKHKANQSEANLFILFIFTFYEDIEAHDPLLVVDVVTRVPVEELEYPVHDDIISDVEVLVKKLAKLLSVQFCIDALRFLKNHHNLLELSICILVSNKFCGGKEKALEHFLRIM